MATTEYSILLDSESLSFTARHFIRYRMGKDSIPQTEPIHTHRFRCRLQITGQLDEDGLLLDFHLTSSIFRQILSELDNRLIVALRQPGLDIKQTGERLSLRFRSVSPETGQEKEEEYDFHSGEIYKLDAVNGSAELIAQHLLTQFQARLKKSLPGTLSLSSFHLTLEEAPGMKAAVSIREN